MFKKGKMSDVEKKAKMAALKEANGMASDALKGKLSGLKKVTVAAPDEKGLKKGLDMAEKVIGEMPDDTEYSEDEELGEQGDSDEAMDEDEKIKGRGFMDAMEESEPMDEEELDRKIQELMALKEKLQK